MLWHWRLTGCVLAFGVGVSAGAAEGTGLPTLERAEGAVESVAGQPVARIPVLEHGLYEDYRVAWASRLKAGANQKDGGNGEELWEAARRAGVHAVVWDDVGTSLQDAWRGMREGILGVAEVTSDGATMVSPECGEAGGRKAGDDGGQMTVHVWARELSEGAIKEALRAGRSYRAHDGMADPTGFLFGAVNNLGVFPMGDRAPWAGKTRVMVLSPVPARWRLWQGDQVVAEATGTKLEQVVEGLGAYRVEGWLTAGGDERLWLCSNPVHVELPSPTLLSLPSSELSPEVRAVKDVVYREGPEEDAAKHRLDLYLPREKAGFPVLFFAHGGAWKYGDRSQYPAIGNRFAKEGMGMVVPSYRLAPKHVHPAQIEDVAAAFAWTVREVAKHGGDPKRIYVAGHSAGGHLVSLLALDPRWLGAHGLTTSSIRGVMTLSGVYDLGVADAADTVFSKDPDRRREASPQAHIRLGAPPFLVTYCEWDYMLLPAQARGFHAALRRAGVASELVFVPGQNHISEMVNVAREGDLTAAAMLRFMR